MLNRKQNAKDKGIYRPLLVGLSSLLLLFQKPKVNKRGVNLQVFRSKNSFSSSTNPKAGLPLLSLALEVGNFKEITHLPLVMKENVSFFFFFFLVSLPSDCFARPRGAAVARPPTSSPSAGADPVLSQLRWEL
jgi:hypothetical protein